MRIAVLMLLCAVLVTGQDAVSRRKQPVLQKPQCAPGAICFSGEVYRDQEFRKKLNDQLSFVLRPGWTIEIVPAQPCADPDDFAGVVNPPYHFNPTLYIMPGWGMKAENAVADSLREFNFVTTCADYRVEADRVDLLLYSAGKATESQYDEAYKKLGTSPLGHGRFWITGSTVKENEITLIRFAVEIKMPASRKPGSRGLLEP